jgi:2-amino-4-hydroxy-6-hydroxymethyldihydropteridine diphosphokinase
METLSIEAGPIVARSEIYHSRAVGPIAQMPFRNCVVILQTNLPPTRLMRLFKQLEHQAGRRPATSVRWGPRPLDIDIVDYSGRICAWRRPKKSGRVPPRAPTHLILPHPQAHVRPFVLVPLLEVLPHWWHPALQCSGRRLLGRLSKPFGLMPD